MFSTMTASAPVLPDLGKLATFECDSAGVIMARNILLAGLCTDRRGSCFGLCHVGYLPSRRILKLDGVVRIIDLLSRQCWIQEYLTMLIARQLAHAVNPTGVGVVIEVRHVCLRTAQFRQVTPVIVTSAMLGVFRRRSSLRQEFLRMV